jgi:hypothetical protein
MSLLRRITCKAKSSADAGTGLGVGKEVSEGIARGGLEKRPAVLQPSHDPKGPPSNGGSAVDLHVLLRRDCDVVNPSSDARGKPADVLSRECQIWPPQRGEAAAAPVVGSQVLATRCAASRLRANGRLSASDALTVPPWSRPG